MLRDFKSLLIVALIASLPAFGQEPDKDKNLDVHSSAGDLHIGGDADARKAGLPLYPGARPKVDDDNNGKVNLGLLTEAFGIKLVVAKYQSDDAPAKVIDYYRDKLSKYGKVLECHSRKEHFGTEHHDDEDDKNSKSSKELKCEGDNDGPVIELKVGTEDNQHVVSIEPAEKGKGSTFALVYVYTRGKRGEI
ncbi:MAG TPA: hypothetical protein VI386_19730 [Candidatus Sulfotelmatobacter sp.]